MNPGCFPTVCAWWGKRLRDQDRRMEFEAKLLAKLEADDIEDRFGSQGRLEVDYEPQGTLREICADMEIEDNIAPQESGRVYDRVFGCGKIWMRQDLDANRDRLGDGVRWLPWRTRCHLEKRKHTKPWLAG